MDTRIVLAVLFVGAIGCDADMPAEANEAGVVYADYHKIAVLEDGFTVTRAPASDPARAVDVDVGEFAANVETEAGCWVVLEWCDAPGPEGAVCTFTDCTIAEAFSACQSLINQTC